MKIYRLWTLKCQNVGCGLWSHNWKRRPYNKKCPHCGGKIIWAEQKGYEGDRNEY